MMKMVVAYDGSDHGDRALERALGIAGPDDELVIVSAARRATLSHDPAGGASAVDPIESEWARENLDKARSRLAGAAPTVRTVEAHGDPADAVVRQANDENADLIVVGTRGLNVAQRALLGSVSTKIVHHASCDVLVVR
jgi:nucleotide-binding universal stress UspA family protein